MKLAALTFIAALGLLLAASAAPVRADVLENLSRAGASYTQGDHAGAIDHLHRALEEIWTQAPLTVRHATFVSEQPAGYGQYTPRASDVFSPLDPIQLYCEPVGYTAHKTGDEYRTALTAGFSVLNEKGQVLGGREEVWSNETKSRSFSTEYLMFFTINLKGLPTGKYTLKVTINDKNGHKSTFFEKPFTVR